MMQSSMDDRLLAHLVGVYRLADWAHGSILTRAGRYRKPVISMDRRQAPGR